MVSPNIDIVSQLSHSTKLEGIDTFRSETGSQKICLPCKKNVVLLVKKCPTLA